MSDTPRFYITARRDSVPVFFTGTRFSPEYPDAFLYSTRASARTSLRAAQRSVTPNTGMLMTLSIEEAA